MGSCTWLSTDNSAGATSTWCSRRVRPPTPIWSNCSCSRTRAAAPARDRVTALILYFSPRQDRRSLPGEAIGARVMAATIDAAGVDRVVVVDPHTAGLEAMFGASVDLVSAMPILLPALEQDVRPTPSWSLWIWAR